MRRALHAVAARSRCSSVALFAVRLEPWSSSSPSSTAADTAPYQVSSATAAEEREQAGGGSSNNSTTAKADHGQTVAREPVRTLYPKIRMRAQTERPAPRFGGDKEGEIRQSNGAKSSHEDEAAPAATREFSGADGSTHPSPYLQPIREKGARSARRAILDTLETDSLLEREASENHAESPQVANRPVPSSSPSAARAPSATASVDDRLAMHEQLELNEVQSFQEAVQHQVELSRLARNQAIPYPAHPDTMVPLFRRVKRHTKMKVVEEDPDYPTFPRKDSFVELPPTVNHPWVKNTPIGHVVHGDGQLGVVGTGEVGFEDAKLLHKNPLSGEADDANKSGATPNADAAVDELTLRKERRGWRGLLHQSILQQHLPQNNGKVLQDAVIKHSFSLTGRGVFATRDVKQGETIMIVESSAQSLGVKGELRRLEDMVADILVATYEACYPEGDGLEDAAEEEEQQHVSATVGKEDGRDADGSGTARRTSREFTTERGAELKAFLHDWILTGQPSSLVEHWPRESTQRVLDTIGGRDVLDALELHTIHIARLAAIIDLNSFLVESFYAERKGMAYFPEAGFLNHSCVPNATYDIMPEHTFRESDYFLDEVVGGDVDDDDIIGQRAEMHEGGEERKAESVSSKTSPSSAAAVDVPPPSSGMPPSPPPRASGKGDTIENGPDSGSKNDGAKGSFDLAAPPDAGNAVMNVKQQPRGGVNFLAHLDDLPDLTETGAPRYLFCCRAEKDIKAGEEILISYIPPGWSFDNRQYVLHDRYHFWCKCPKCAPILDKKYARIPRFLVGIVVLSIALQALVLYQRDRKNDVDEELERLNAMSEEERIDELRARGIDLEDLSMDAKVRHREERQRKGQSGLFEMLEREKLRRAYDIDGPITPKESLLESQNPYPRKPFGL